MSNKKLTMLGVVAAVMVVLAVLQSQIMKKIPAEATGSSNLIQGLDISSITSVTVTKGAEQATLQRSGEKFFVANKDGYPADTSRVNDLLIRCLDIKVKAAELITSNSALHKDLGVSEDTAGSNVKFFDKNDQFITGLLVSEVSESEDVKGVNVRLSTGNDVYRALDVPWFSGYAMDYVDKQFVVIKEEDIASVTVSLPEERYTLKRSDSGDIVLENMPAGKKFKSDSPHKEIFSLLTDMRFTEVQKESAETADLKFDSTYTCRLADKSVYTFKIAQKESKTYVQCTGIAGKDKGWIFEVPQWKAANLTKKLADLLEDIEVEKPQAEQTGETPQPEKL